MNILASFDWLKEYVKKTPSVEEFVRRMTEVGNSVERSIDVGASFDHMVVGKVLEVKPHPNADKLRVVVTDVGEEVEIVCGGSNLEVGHLVAVALPGSKVKWHGEGELMEIKETELRGVKSFGMICAASEIGFEKLKQGEKEIWDLTEITNAKPGTPLAEALDLDDVLFDIEVTTNRPDAMSIVGLAREAGAAGLGKCEMRNPKFETNPKTEKGKGKAKMDVRVEASDLCPRYQAVVIENVKVAPSPWWMQKRLLLAGHRPINNVVDITNYILHELGQPLHAFDADKLEGEKIIVRKAKKGEKILALDGKEYELDPSMLAICDGARPVAVAGVMGGEPTGTTEATTRLVIESACFNPVSVRRTARALNLYSDSSSLFEKGLSTESTTAALHRAIELICELTGGNVASEIVDERAQKYQPLSFPYDSERVSGLIGIDVPMKKQVEILEGLGFEVDKGNVTVPYWRDHDIEDSVDFVEEVARMVGYGNLPSVIPAGSLPTPIVEPAVIWERKIKEILRSTGLTETYGLALVSLADLQKMDVDPAAMVHVQNPLSEDLAYLRTSLWPSMLNAVEQNQHRFPEAELFELSVVHEAQSGDIPKHEWHLAIAVYGSNAEACFRRAKGITERLWRETGLNGATFTAQSAIPFLHPGRSATLTWNGQTIGAIGQLSSTYANRFGIDKQVVIVGMNVEKLLPHFGVRKTYTEVPVFQDTIRDVSFVLAERSTYEEVVTTIHKANALIADVALLDVYQGKGIDPGKKSMAFRLSLRASDRTLSSEEADAVMQSVVNVLQSQFSAIIR